MYRTYREAYAGLPAATWMLSAIAFVHRSGTMVIPFLALYLTKDQGYSAALAGQLIGLYGVGWMVGSYLGGWMTDRIGAPNVQVFGLVAQGSGFLVLGQIESGVALAVTLFTVGALGDVFRPANAALVTSTCAPEARTKALALNRLAINLGMAIGPSVGGFLAVVDYSWLFLVDAITCWLGAGLVLIWFRGARAVRPTPAVEGTRSRSPWRDAPFLLCISCTCLLAAVAMQMMSTMPLFFSQHYGMTEDVIGLVFAVNPVLIVAFEMVLVHRLRDRSPLRIIAMGSVLLAVSYAILPLGVGVAWAVLFTVISSIAEMLESPQSGGFVAARADDGNRGRYMGIYTMSWAAAAVAAPIAGMSIYDRFGPSALWFGCAVACIAIAVCMFALDRALSKSSTESAE